MPTFISQLIVSDESLTFDVDFSMHCDKSFILELSVSDYDLIAASSKPVDFPLFCCSLSLQKVPSFNSLSPLISPCLISELLPCKLTPKYTEMLNRYYYKTDK
jgi:hypothetical protein